MENPRIAVFDFKPQDGEQAAEAIRAHYRWLDQNPEIAIYNEQVPFCTSYMDMCRAGKHYDMIFVGADTMKGVDGMLGVETGRNIRELDSLCTIFHVSHSDDYMLEAYRQQTRNYLTKPMSPEKVEACIQRLNFYNCSLK